MSWKRTVLTLSALLLLIPGPVLADIVACGGVGVGTVGSFTISPGKCDDPCDPTLMAQAQAEALLDAMDLADATCGAGRVCSGGSATADNQCESKSIMIGELLVEWCVYTSKVTIEGGTCQ